MPRYPLNSCQNYTTCGIWQGEKERLEAHRSLYRIQKGLYDRRVA